MTSEVAVLNKQAVVLAADSAVTSGGKIFNTISKVFALSKYEPVGIMVYSSAEVMGVPVETVIKKFRHSRGKYSCASLDAYANEFRNFLETDVELFPDSSRYASLNALVETVADKLHSIADKRLRTRIQHGQKPTKTNIKKALQDTIGEFQDALRNAPRISTVGISRIRLELANVVSGEIDEVVKWLKQYWPITQAMERSVRKLILEQFFREAPFGGETGFVVAGFGTNDVFPRLRAFDFYCSALGLNKVINVSEADITDRRSSCVRAFAQSEVVVSFMEGIDPRYKALLSNFPANFFVQQHHQLLNGTSRGKQRAALVEKVGREFVDALQKEMESVARSDFVQPTMDIVAMMPKEDLAVLAEALVNLTSLKLKTSPYAETVGGPTDVAVISKGDGLVWIKRKHYFDPKLNPGFIARYLEVNEDE